MDFAPILSLPSLRWEDGAATDQAETVAEEVPVALVYNGVSHVVMMATPQDLEDFALGFSLSEGILEARSELLDCRRRDGAIGIEMELSILNERFSALKARRRNLTGRTGCGLCGVDSLAEAIRPARLVEPGPPISPAAIAAALAALPDRQLLNREAGAIHAAAWAKPDGTIAEIREDVGRHNALDKLIGAMARSATDPRDGFLLVTSRCSYEMVQKATAAGIGLIVAISAPTALAIRMAEQAGIGLVAFARGERHARYANPERVSS